MSKILSCTSDELEENLKHWQPDQADDVAFSITLEIGDSNRFDLYYGRVVTPNNVGRSAEHSIVLPWYSWEALEKSLSDILRDCPNTQPEESQYLCRYFRWEYEKYKG